MAYVMEHEDECLRLEQQSLQEAYNLESEMAFLNLSETSHVADLGSGTGLVPRYLLKAHPNITVDAYEFSDHRIRKAIELAGNHYEQSLKFFQTDLEKQPLPESQYDAVTCRFVLEHLTDPLSLCKKIFKSLKPQGIAYLIDLDGVFVNFFTKNQKLNDEIKFLESKISFDLRVGGKMPAYLHWCGFEEINYQVQLLDFTGPARTKEIENFVERLNFSMPTIVELLGSEKRAQNFFHSYINELSDPSNPLQFNKFIAWGKKPKSDLKIVKD